MRYVVLALAAVMIVTLAWANWPRKALDPSARADRVVVYKSERRLDLLFQGSVLKSYRVSLGGEPKGPKQGEGDHRTPEGLYTLDYRKPDSSFHKALHISYPSPANSAAASVAGWAPGGQVMVHGLPNGHGWLGRLHLAYDWTDGCVAVTNREIEEIWRAVPDGTPIELRP
jgi:murein L,D-transpeptidase YafK